MMTPAQIREARFQLGMTQHQLAVALGLASYKTVASWESARRTISNPAVVAIGLMLRHGQDGINKAGSRPYSD